MPPPPYEGFSQPSPSENSKNNKDFTFPPPAMFLPVAPDSISVPTGSLCFLKPLQFNCTGTTGERDARLDNACRNRGQIRDSIINHAK